MIRDASQKYGAHMSDTTTSSIYLAALEHGLNASGTKSVAIPSEKATIPIKACGVGGSALTKEVRLVPMRL